MCWWLSVCLHASWDISLLPAPPVRSEKRNNHCPGPPPCPQNLEARGVDVEREKCQHLCSGRAAGYLSPCWPHAVWLGKFLLTLALFSIVLDGSLSFLSCCSCLPVSPGAHTPLG